MTEDIMRVNNAKNYDEKILSMEKNSTQKFKLSDFR